MPAFQGIQQIPGQPPFRRPTPQLYPLGIERKYARELRGLMAIARRIILDNLIPTIPGILLRSGLRRDLEGRLDAPFDDIEAIMSRVREEFERKAPETSMSNTALRAAQATNLFNRAQIDKQTKALIGKEVLRSETWLGELTDQFTRQNVSLIKTIPSQYFDKIESSVKAGVQAGSRATEIGAQIRNLYPVSVRRANFIARDQVGKLNGNLTRERQGDLGVRRYVWRTSLDERVRDDHRALEGKIFSWKNPPVVDTRTGRRAHPGEDFNCRCHAEPVVADLLDGQFGPLPAGEFPVGMVPPLRARAQVKASVPSKIRRKVSRPKVPRPPPRRPGDRTPWKGRRPTFGQIENMTAKYSPTLPPDKRTYALIDNWVHGSGRRTSVLMQEAARQEFKLGGMTREKVRWKLKGPEIAAVRGDVKEMYRRTQAELRRRGIKEITLYRGVKSNLTHNNAFRSYTSKRQIAERFDGEGVEVRKVPASKVFSWHDGPDWHNGIWGQQWEYIVLD